MNGEPTYWELEQKIKNIEREFLEYVRKEEKLSRKRRSIEYKHMRRTISLMKINEELEKEIKDCISDDAEELTLVSQRLRERANELNCLYNISRYGASPDFSLDTILQTIVDLIPPAFRYPEIICARAVFERYEFTTENFKDTKWKSAKAIVINGEQIGALEVCYLTEPPAINGGTFYREATKLIGVIAETIAKIVEREWAEDEIRKHRNRVEKLIKTISINIDEKTNE